MALKAAFIFLAAGAKPDEHRSVVRTPQVDLVVVGVPDYAQAEIAAKSLVNEGVAAIELCGGCRALRWPSWSFWQEWRSGVRSAVA